MIKKVAVAVLIVMIASLSVAGAGCISTPTSTGSNSTVTSSNSSSSSSSGSRSSPTAEEFTKSMESTNSIAVRTFTKSVNGRGNAVYKGITRNATKPNAREIIVTAEFAKSQDEAKSIYNTEKAKKQSEGYTTPDPTIQKSQICPNCTGFWAADNYPYYCCVEYMYNSQFQSWIVMTQVPNFSS